ncbi:DUF1553 domain-containing protein [Dyadobacter chenhuakuii]|uniref:DUF1553 domain-containing protein n=1 Tax=Dyadobacter chenhuakuii TaxID=2909339 RepID=A0ABY4XLZ4_9BACT|nr:DUF1553 domain-containing protein [Dyadobacter chenhuakuii]MCF2494339.1 DUF1553 domain-containing protein [Dyadobacter chenhuakuii]USJ31461.1 DUF1553 domain-containing protein [Dyadobacter chenhuakuii]
MLSNRIFIGAGILIIAVSSFFWLSGSLAPSSVDYNTEVKPILNKHCMGCHGGVKKAGDVSFLFEHEMLEPGKSGKIPVVRGDADASEMIRRILSDDPDEKMPKNGTPLKEEEIDILKKWINQGAKWETHWSYKKIEKPDVPSLNGFSNLFGLFDNEEKKWATNEIDHFVLEKLKDKGLHVSAEADRATLIRRVSLDLTGLPPTEKQVADFINDKSENAYGKVVDRLLKSPAYGERWTSMWMDLARYADTKGYESDGGRTMWRYRDYVVKSFNEDKPFDQFTIEQLAGDLLQKDKDGFPLEENMIATGYHRNTMTNNEGGTDDEEFRTAAQIDRVNTTWEVWQGTTFACIQCHSHPYDPIPHEDYYKYMAFFNNTRDEDVWDEWPKMRFYKGEDSVRVERVKSWIRQNKPEQLPQVTQFMKVMEPKINAHNFVKGNQSTVLLISYYGVKNNGNARIAQVDLSEADNVVMNVSTKAQNAVLSLHLDKLDGPVISQIRVPARDSVIIAPLTKMPGKHDIFLSLKSPKNPEEWVRITWMSFQKALPGQDKPEYNNIVADYATVLTRQTESMPVIWEGKGDFARKTNVFVRGNWMVKGAEVKPDVPKLLAPMPKDAPRDRVGLAKWIVSRDNALTSRVIVNRFWEQLFGKGIVETVEDFGSQGAEPTHPELLDWLAVKFMEEDKWSIKKMLKTIVMSSTYRQSSKTDENKLEKDPYNIWISRGPRVRLSAEQVRDQALACSGLISDKMYGPGVMPPQPDKIWQSPYSGEKWVLSEGEDRYRRGVYTYWKRTAPYPSMVTFDAPSREFCQSRRILTNTPLQALVTLNDPVYLEAAEKLATRMQQRGKTPEQQLKEGYRMLTFQNIEQKNLNVLVKVYKQALDAYKKKPVEADSILAYGKERTPELAALTISANVMLNLDNVITKE